MFAVVVPETGGMVRRFSFRVKKAGRSRRQMHPPEKVLKARIRAEAVEGAVDRDLGEKLVVFRVVFLQPLKLSALRSIG